MAEFTLTSDNKLSVDDPYLGVQYNSKSCMVEINCPLTVSGITVTAAQVYMVLEGFPFLAPASSTTSGSTVSYRFLLTDEYTQKAGTLSVQLVIIKDDVVVRSELAYGSMSRSETIGDAPASLYPSILDEANKALVQMTELDDSAYESATAAHTSEVNAKTSETNAKTSETNAASSASSALTSKNAAASSASAALTSQNAAKTSETNSKTSETNAKTSETNSASSAAAALASKNAAATSETNAASSASAALTSKNAAASSASAALTSQNAAKTSETNAKTSETNAKTSETNAKTSETNSASSASAALASKNAAATSETNAKTSETNAASSASDALASKNAAATSETNAASSASGALASKNAAATSETNATTKATAAGNSALDSEAWATGKRNGTAVGSGDATYNNSSKYYADRAQQIETAAETAENTRVSNETARQSAESSRVTAEQNRVTADNNRAYFGVYSPTTHYALGNQVALDGNTYRCKSSCTGVTPPNDNNWTLVSSKGSSGVYVGSGDMPEGYNVQIELDGECTGVGGFLIQGNGYSLDNGSIRPTLGLKAVDQSYNAQASPIPGAKGDYAYSEGYQTNAPGTGAHSEGYCSVAAGLRAHAENESYALGDYSHSEGKETRTYAEAGHAEGQSSISFGPGSHAEGNSVAAGGYDHSEGSGACSTTAGGHSEGFGSLASSGTYYKVDSSKTTSTTLALVDATGIAVGNSIILGCSLMSRGGTATVTVISGNLLTLGGITPYDTVNPLSLTDITFIIKTDPESPGFTHAEGLSCMALGMGSHAQGLMTRADGIGQHVSGILNIPDTTSLEIVGNATPGDTVPSNARTLDKEGNGWFAGRVSAGTGDEPASPLDPNDLTPAQSVANALTKTVRGNSIRVDDVSPLSHNLGWTQYGQCSQNGTPTPSAPIPVLGKIAGANICGKNLLDKTTMIQNTALVWDTGATFSETNSISSDKIRVEPGKTYCTNFAAQWVGYKGDGTYVKQITSGQNDVMSATIPAGVTFIKLGFRTGSNSGVNLVYSDLQLELGPSSTGYEFYNGILQTIKDNQGNDAVLYGIPVSSEGNVTIGNQQYVADTVDLSGNIRRRIGVQVLTGTESWTQYSTGFSYCYSRSFTGAKTGYQTSICSHFKNVNAAWDAGVGANGRYSDHSTSTVKYFDTTEYATVDAWKAYLAAQYSAGTPVTVYYILALYQREYVTPANTGILAICPTTTLSADAYTELFYNQDPSIVADSKANKSDTDLPVTNMITDSNYQGNWLMAGFTSTPLNPGLRLVTTATGQGNHISQTVNVISGHKYYYKVYFNKVSGTTSAIFLSDSNALLPSVSPAIVSGYNTISTVQTATGTGSTDLRLFRTQDAAIGDVFELYNSVFVDLTAAFCNGSTTFGDEPTATQMDAILSYYPNRWFAGTVNLATSPKLLPYLLKILRSKADIAQEAWTTPTLTNGATQHPTRPVQYYKDSLGIVHFRGAFTTPSSTNGVSCITLPTGYRGPSIYDMEFAVAQSVSATAFTRVDIATSSVKTYIASTSIEMSGVSYKGEA